MGQRDTQCRKLLDLLSEREGQEVPLYPDIMGLYLASHTRRVSDLRKMGHDVQCRIETVEGQKRSFYRLVPRNGA